MIAGPGTSLLCRSARVGLRVRLTSAFQVRWSTSPVLASSRLPWNPLTALVVALP